MLVKQRDNEIGILLNYLNKKKEGAAVQGVGDLPVQRSNGFTSPNTSGMDTTQASASKGEEQKQGTLFQMMNQGNKSIKEKRLDFEMNQQTAKMQASKNMGLSREVEEVQQMVSGPIQCTMEDLADRAKSFDMFRKSYRKNEAMEDNRELLKQKYARGK